MAKKKKRSKIKSLKARIKKIKKKIIRKYKDAYYIHKYNKSKIDENAILIESKNGDDIAGNMYYILKELTKSDYSNFRVYVVASRKNMISLQAMLDHYKIANAQLVERLSLDYYRLLASAKYLFTDSTFPKFFIKKEGQIYTNTWHGTPLKCMINDVPNRRYAMGNGKRNFLMCDYLVYPNDEMEEKMLSAYSMEQLYQGKILNAGYPRNAVFFNKERAVRIKKELGLEDKYVSVYMPTWRGIMTKRAQGEQFREIIDSLRVLDSLLDDSHVFFVKMHVLVQKSLDFSAFKHIKSFPVGYETYDLLNSADCLVTDYSSVFFDFANTGKKIVLYTYDREEYISTRGLYYDLDAFPFPKVETPEALYDALVKEKDYDDTEFIKKFCTYDNPYAPEALVKYVIKGEESPYVKVKQTVKNGKDNVLIYSGSLALNGLTSSLVSLSNVIDLQKENIFITFREKSLKKEPLRLEKFSRDIDVFPMVNGFKYSVSEMIAYVIFYKLNINSKWAVNRLDLFYKREVKRFFGNAQFDKAIHFPGYEMRIIGLFQRIPAKRAIFVHNDMVQEMKTKKNQHYLSIKNAYNEYDRVVCVTEDVKDSLLKIHPNGDNVVIVNNAHNYKAIQDKMEQEFHFDYNTVSNVSENVIKQLLQKEDTIKFITIGRYSPEKGHKRLIDAFDKFYQEHENSYLYIVGGYGVLWKQTNEYIKTKKCKYNVILIRRISNPFPLLKQCDLFVLSSFYEALGLVLLEAQTCGVPVISTDISGPRGFLLKHNGRLVENSEAGILQGMNDFMDGKIKLMDFDPEEYNNMVKKEYENIFE